MSDTNQGDAEDRIIDQIIARPATPEEVARLAGEQPMAPPPTAPDGRQRPRLTVAGSVYYQSHGTEPFHQDVRFSRWLEDTEQDPYFRPRLRVGPEWQPIETGWVQGDPSLVVVANRKDAPATQPTEAERVEAESRVIEVGMLIDLNPPPEQRTMHDKRHPVVVATVFVIRPGEAQAWTPASGSLPAYRVRCVAGETRASVAVVPC